MTWGLPRDLSDDVNCVKARHIRAARREQGLCVNGRAKATSGCRCKRCHLVHKYSLEVARDMAEYKAAPLCNPPKNTTASANT